MNNRMHWRLVVGRIVRISLGILFLLYIPSSLAQASLAELINALQAGGKIVYLRHAATDHSMKDMERQDLQDCSRQRNLSAKGRQQAEDIGKAIKALKIPVGEVTSSPYCRCKDTAQLALGKFTVNPDLQFSISKDGDESARLGEQLRIMMLTADIQDTNAFFVGHTSNLRDGIGVWPKPEGVAVVFERQGGKLRLMGFIKPDDWSQVMGNADQ